MSYGVLLVSVLLMRSASSISSRNQDRSQKKSLSVFAPGWSSNQRIPTALTSEESVETDHRLSQQ